MVGEYRIPSIYDGYDLKKFENSYSGDKTQYEWKLNNKYVAYYQALYENIPDIIEAFGAQTASVRCCYYDHAYEGGYHGDNDEGLDEHGYSLAVNEIYNRLKADPAIHVNGWNNIYTLGPAQYWDEGRCHRALGYGPDEVIRRLSDKVPLVRPLRDGVYLVLNDNPEITYDEYYAMNIKIKAILGLA